MKYSRGAALASYLRSAPKLRHPHVREEAKLRVRRLLLELPAFISYRSAYTNVYHCCLARTGSQWMKRMLSDPRVFRNSGLKVHTYQDGRPGRVDLRLLTERTFEAPFPRERIVTPLYLSYDNLQELHKPDSYRAFFVYRDPRDIVVSGYFLRRNTATLGNTAEERDHLQSVSLEDGLLYMIERLHRRGLFEAFRSWHAALEDENVKLIAYEDLTGEDGFGHLQDLFNFCDISIEGQEFRELLNDCRFDRLSGGRTAGHSDRASHYRKGLSGDWINHFTPRVQGRFAEAAGDLLQLFGYAERDAT